MKTENPGVVISVQNSHGDDRIILQGECVSVAGALHNSEENGNLNLGVCLADTSEGEMMPVAITGVALVKTGGAVTAGQYLSCDTDVCLGYTLSDPPTATELAKCVAKAIDSASGAGEFIRAKLI